MDAMAVVLQKTVLFSGTVRENLAWGDADATDEQMLEACRLARADEFLDRIGGLDGELGQGSAGVSGGSANACTSAQALPQAPARAHPGRLHERRGHGHDAAIRRRPWRAPRGAIRS